jgi:hypothetical protein
VAKALLPVFHAIRQLKLTAMESFSNILLPLTSVLVKIFPSLFNKEASKGYSLNLNKDARILYKGTDIFSKCGSPCNKDADIFNKETDISYKGIKRI